MKNFALFLRANREMSRDSFSDPQEIALRSQWLNDIEAKGIVVNLGGTLPPIPAMSATINSENAMLEGPFSEDIHFLTGYLVIKAADLAAAMDIARTNPIINAGGSVEVREILLR